VLARAESKEPAPQYNILDPNRGFDMLPELMKDRIQDPCRDTARKQLGYAQ
jgi:hypothetical protein